MKSDQTIFHHYGNKTVIKVPKNKDALNQFINKLEESGFEISPESAFRKSSFSSNDWPIQIDWKAGNNFYEISALMFIPWSWIWVTITTLCILPTSVCWFIFNLTKFEFFALWIFCAIFLFFTAFKVFRKIKTAPKQKFDFSPKNNWQRLPKNKWYTRLKQYLESCFNILIFEEESNT